MAFTIFEFLANRTALLGFRLTNIDNCSNNQIILIDKYGGDDSRYISNPKFAQPKNTNLLPDPGKQNPQGTTFDNQLIELDSVDSTNNYAMGRIHAGLAFDGMTCLARHQWAGKGQRGKTWLSEPGQNLIMSLVLEPGKLNISQQFLFSAAVALAILDQVRQLEKNGWTVKWPNDIFWNDRKAAGILIESILQGTGWSWAVVGIGMNLNQDRFPSEVPDAVSLKQITGKDYDPKSLARDLIPAIRFRVSQLVEDQDGLLQQYNENLYHRGQTVGLIKGNERIVASLIGVDLTGTLITDNGRFRPGDIQFISE
jgi:BirA family transcriptional regulator, biotin operon repressor / biotin---[acetyl-CoA-carboxylase] ligase